MKHLFPLMTSFIAGAVAWKLGKVIEGRFLSLLFALIGTTLGFYYGRKYIKELLD
jgi:positive regulator of sigma E activity